MSQFDFAKMSFHVNNAITSQATVSYAVSPVSTGLAFLYTVLYIKGLQTLVHCYYYILRTQEFQILTL